MRQSITVQEFSHRCKLVIHLHRLKISRQQTCTYSTSFSLLECLKNLILASLCLSLSLCLCLSSAPPLLSLSPPLPRPCLGYFHGNKHFLFLLPLRLQAVDDTIDPHPKSFTTNQIVSLVWTPKTRWPPDGIATDKVGRKPGGERKRKWQRAAGRRKGHAGTSARKG